MPKFYATHDSDDGKITENAHIAAFGTRAEAEKYLRDSIDKDATAEIEVGHYGDCWIRSSKAPRVGERSLKPFSYNQVYIARPGSHPGHNVYWITPRVDVLVARFK